MAHEVSDLERTDLCAMSAQIVDVTGAGVMIMGAAQTRSVVCSSDAVSARLEELQFTLGEGPCVDAYNQNAAVSEPNLADPGLTRWIAFTAAALAAGARAVFGFPVCAGSVRLGALNLYRDRAGALTAEQHADAILMAELAANVLLVTQADSATGDVTGAFGPTADFRHVIHQASGMVSVQLEVSVQAALVCLRAAAFAGERSLTEIAEDVVARKLRLD